jgi:cell division protease FtsH
MNSKAKAVVYWVVLFVVAALIWAVSQNKPNLTKATYSQFLQQVQAGQVSNATIEAEQTGVNPVMYSMKDGSQARSVLPGDYRDALAAMREKMVNIEIQDASAQWIRVFLNASPFLVLVGFWLFMMNRMKATPAAK